MQGMCDLFEGQGYRGMGVSHVVHIVTTMKFVGFTVWRDRVDGEREGEEGGS